MWREGDDTFYSLLAGTNRNKTPDEIGKAAVKDFGAVKAKLGELKSGQYVSVLGRRRGDRPPQGAVDEAEGYCKTVGLKTQ